jgi:hypothetical protein
MYKNQTMVVLDPSLPDWSYNARKNNLSGAVLNWEQNTAGCSIFHVRSLGLVAHFPPDPFPLIHQMDKKFPAYTN